MKLTVKGLIEKLKALPPELPVFVEGYEGGLVDILEIKKVNVALNSNKKDWLGPHEEDPKSKDLAVAIYRGSNPNAT